MAFTINTNIASMQAQEYLRQTGDFQNKTINRVTSGLRIVNSGDDAAGLAIANSYRSDQAVLSQGVRNANDGIATLQTIDSGISNIGKLLDRARTLAAQSASDTFTGDRSALNSEFSTVMQEIDRQAQTVGLVASGEFARSMMVFIGGGRDITGGTTAIDNGAIGIDFSKSLIDRTSLGLASNGIAGARDLRSGTSYLAAAKLVNGGVAAFNFQGAGFAAGVNVSVDISSVSDERDLATAINKAVQTTGATNSAFAAAGIKASIDANGHLNFTSTSAIEVNSAAGTAAVGLLDNTTNSLYSTGTFKTGALAFVALNDAAIVGGGAGDTISQRVNLAFKDSDGNVKNSAVTFTHTFGGANVTIDDAVIALNTQLAADGSDVYAMKDSSGSSIVFVSKSNTSFQVDIDATTKTVGGVLSFQAAGLNTGSQAVAAAATTGANTAADIGTSSSAQLAVTALAQAVRNLGAVQATVGRAQNQLSYAISLASSQLTNLAASESRIRDADLATEAANLTKAQILTQAGVAALAQANSAPQAVLNLLKG